VYPKLLTRWFVLLILLAASVNTAANVQAEQLPAKVAQSDGVTAYDLILAMNALRTSYGLPVLVEDPIINAVAQSTAEIMAANQMSWHIGDVDGRLTSAGYGGGAKVWATENFAVGSNHTIDEIMVVWSDESHMIPAVNPAYCHVGAGVAKSPNGMTYYVLQAAYTAGKSCGEYRSPGGSTQPGDNTGEGRESSVSQLIVPVKVATPDIDGRVYHVVEAGQSFWAIAIAYKLTIKDLETWNNLSRESKLQIGQRLFIPGSNTAGYATPTPVGMVQISTPDADGKIVHAVQPYQTLITIAQAYQIDVERILQLNGIQADWPLQIGQNLVIDPGSVTPTPTPRPLTPIEKLTPASDGKYYHTVMAGETLSWIAQLYEVTVTDLMVWNGLNASSVLHPEQKLVLQVTPPATETPIPLPATATLTATAPPPTPTPSMSPTRASISPTATTASSPAGGGNGVVWFVSIGLAAGGIVIVYLSRKRP
jgi:LysM repeat protein